MRKILQALVLVTLSLGSHLVLAQATRTWVSGVGDDANPCSRTAPCKTFAGAISKTAANGKINVLDPGGYGAVTITKSITIEADGDPAGVLVSGTNAIIINAGVNDVVTLRNIKFEGISSGLNAIRILAAATVLVDQCTLEDFADNLVSIENTGASKVVIRNSVLRRSGNLSTEALVRAAPAVGASTNLSIDDSTLFASGNGVLVVGDVEFNVRDSIITGGLLNGIQIDDAAGISAGWAENVQITDFGGGGISVSGNDSRLRVVNSTISDNAAGLISASGGQIISFGDNRLSGNVANGGFTGSEAKQ